MPGIGKKAVDGDPVIGFVLEDFADAATTTYTYVRKVLLYVNLGHAKLDNDITSGSLLAGSSTIDQISGAFEPLADSLDLAGKDIIHVRSILAEGGKWSISPEGLLVVERIETNELHVKNKAEIGAPDAPRGVTLYDANGSGQPYCFYIQDGVPATVSGTCEANQHLFSKTALSSPVADSEEVPAPEEPATDPSGTPAESPPLEEQPLASDPIISEPTVPAGELSPPAEESIVSPEPEPVPQETPLVTESVFPEETAPPRAELAPSDTTSESPPTQTVEEQAPETTIEIQP